MSRTNGNPQRLPSPPPSPLLDLNGEIFFGGNFELGILPIRDLSLLERAERERREYWLHTLPSISSMLEEGEQTPTSEFLSEPPSPLRTYSEQRSQRLRLERRN